MFPNDVRVGRKGLLSVAHSKLLALDSCLSCLSHSHILFEPCLKVYTVTVNVLNFSLWGFSCGSASQCVSFNVPMLTHVPDLWQFFCLQLFGSSKQWQETCSERHPLVLQSRWRSEVSRSLSFQVLQFVCRLQVYIHDTAWETRGGTAECPVSQLTHWVSSNRQLYGQLYNARRDVWTNPSCLLGWIPALTLGTNPAIEAWGLIIALPQCQPLQSLS